MADKIKKFFEKKKSEAKFKKAGPGHRLNETRSEPISEKSGTSVAAPRAPPSAESKQAAAAALARLGGGKTNAPAFNTSLAAIQAKVKKELEAEKKLAATAIERQSIPSTEQQEPKEFIASPLLAVRGVYFKCPLIGPEILSKEEWKVKIKEFLYEQLSDEKGLTACLIIHSCNKSKDKVEQCVETLCKYLENILNNPEEEKYQRIRVSNRIFQEKVASLEGALEFLFAAGFVQQMLPFQEVDEEFLVFDKTLVEDLETLDILRDALRSAEPIGLELDRNMQVLLPSQAAKKTELPRDFFSMTPEEIKKEQQLKAERIENTQILRTKAMREKEELREMRKYKFALIRIRFPDGIMLQGTFGVYEKMSEVFDFVRENIEAAHAKFIFLTGTGHQIVDTDENKSLIELHLVPASILIFTWDGDPPECDMILKPEVMVQLQSL